MRVIFALLLLLTTLRSEDFDSIFHDLVLINYQLKTSSDARKEEVLKTNKHNELSRLVRVVLDSKINLGPLKQEEATLEEINLKENSQASYIRLQEIRLKVIFYEFIKDLKLSRDRGETLDLIDRIKRDFEDISRQDLKAIDLKPDSKDGVLNSHIKQYEIHKQTYLELLGYIKTNILHLKKLSFSFGATWLLDGAQSLLQKTGWHTSGVIVKLIFSGLVLVLLLVLRRFVAELIFVVINYFFTKIGSKSDGMHKRVRQNITTPLTYILLFIGLNIASVILYSPSLLPSSLTLIFGTLYIANIAWLCITLLKSYGVVLMDKFLAQRHGFRHEVVNLILKVGYFIIFVVALLSILSFLGFNISTIVASLGIGGLAVALALRDMLANFFASVMLLFENSFSQGDWIVCGKVEGTVVEMGLRRTLVRTFDNALVFVPNSTLANDSILNWNRRKVGRRIKMNIGVTYGSKIEQLRACIKDIRAMLASHPDIVQPDASSVSELDYELQARMNIISISDLLGYKNNSLVFLDSFDSSSINILVYCFSHTVQWAEFLAVKEDVMFRIMKIIDSNGLSFAFPSQSVYIESLPDSKGGE